MSKVIRETVHGADGWNSPLEVDIKVSDPIEVPDEDWKAKYERLRANVNTVIPMVQEAADETDTTLDAMLYLAGLFSEKCEEVDRLKAALRDITLRKGLVVGPGEVRVKEHKRPKPRPKTKPQKWDETICPECGKTLGEPNPGCSFTHFIHSHVERCEFCGVERTGNEHPSPLCQGAVLGIKPEGHKWRVVGPGTVTWENLPNPPSVQESLPEATTEPQRPVEPVARPICRDGAPMPQAQPSEATEASEEEGALPRLRVLVDGEYEEASDALVDTVNGIRLALSGITVWNCEGCGKPISKYPCKCGYPESDEVKSGGSTEQGGGMGVLGPIPAPPNGLKATYEQIYALAPCPHCKKLLKSENLDERCRCGE